MKIIDKRNKYLGKRVKLIASPLYTYEVLNGIEIKVCEKDAYMIVLRNIDELTLIYYSYENFIESIKDGSIKIL
jgi:hypothetical protein